MTRRFPPRGLRWRVTGAVTLLFTLALVGGSVLFLDHVGAALVDDVHADARERLETVRAELTSEHRGLEALPDDRIGITVQDGITSVIVVSGDGFAVASQDGEVQPAEDLRSEVSARGADVPAWLADTQELVAVTSVPATTSDGRVELLAASPLDAVHRTLATTRQVLWVAIPALIALFGLTAWAVSGRALRPVEAITRRAEAITGATLNDRVPEPGTGDEVAHLARTVNGMLDRIQAATMAQRRFTSDAAHELRTPVATIRTELEVALRDGQPAWREVAERVLAEDLRLGRLVDDLLLLARNDERPGPRTMVDVDLDEVVATCSSRSRQVPVDLQRVVPARIEGDPVDLGRAVDHVLDNAARHATTAVEVTTEAHGDTIILHVDDDGSGIPSADREHVLERFTRRDESRSRDRGGAGLGLAVVDRIVTEHRGQVTISDAPLGGARVTLTFPAPGR